MWWDRSYRTTYVHRTEPCRHSPPSSTSLKSCQHTWNYVRLIFCCIFFTFFFLPFVFQIESLTSAKASEDLIINELKELLLKSTEKEKETKTSLDKTLLEIEELRVTSESQEGEINRLKRCTDSQSRDLKRAIREKDNIAKSLQESVAAAAAAAAAAASASASASRVRTSRTNSPLQVVKT